MIEIREVSRIFGGRVIALDNISLIINEGEFITLLGPSGCGKTTLLRLLAGFDTPTHGQILLGGEDVTNTAPYDRDVNMVFQDYALFPHLSVAKNIAFGLERKGMPKPQIATAVRDALAMVELSDKINGMPNELSGGQRQRVALARALVRGPKVLLLDEPLSALDAGLRENMQVELKKLHEKLGITFVMVTHDQTEALAMSDRIVLMSEGRIAQVGTPEALYHKPRSSYVASFIGTTNQFDGTVHRSSMSELLVETAAGKFLCLPRPDLAEGTAVRVGVRPEHLQIAREGSTRGPNILHCAVQDVLFHGSRTRFRCAVGDLSEQLYWDWQQPRQAEPADRPGVGSPITLVAQSSDLFVFERGNAV